MSKTFINIPSYTWQSPVQTLAELPNSGNIGDVRLVIDQSAEYWWDGTTWIPTIAGGGSTNSFVIMQTDLGTYPTATSATDTLTFTSSDNSITITGNSATDTIDLKVAAVGVVSSVNFLTGALTINSGTSGTDFAVNSSGSTITLNLPIASATNTGKLSSTDWLTFNSKQNALGFTPEDVANKATDFSTVNHTLYPTTQAVATTFIRNSFETVSKNLRQYPYALNYSGGSLSTMVYDLGGGQSITKTFNYTLDKLTSIVLSGDTPGGIDLTKTLSYTGDDLTGVAYS